jgi:rod shape-determining protein MreD
MERNLLWLMLFLCFVIESSVVPLMIPSFGDQEISAHFVLILVMMIGLKYNRHSALLYGICFGFIHDVLYGPMLGVTAFSMGLMGYLIGLIFSNRYDSLVRDVFVLIFGYLIFEVITSTFLIVFRLVDPIFSIQIVVNQLFPSIIINLIFAIFAYRPVKRFLQKMVVRYGNFSSV